MQRTASPSRYKGFRSPQEIISHAVWLSFRLSLLRRRLAPRCRPRAAAIAPRHGQRKALAREAHRRSGRLPSIAPTRSTPLIDTSTWRAPAAASSCCTTYPQGGFAPSGARVSAALRLNTSAAPPCPCRRSPPISSLFLEARITSGSSWGKRQDVALLPIPLPAAVQHGPRVAMEQDPE